MLFFRLISSKDCDKCKAYKNVLDKQGFAYEEYDADNTENQVQLDAWKIDDMPVVQIVHRLDDGTEIVKCQFLPGAVSTRSLNHKMKYYKDTLGGTK